MNMNIQDFTTNLYLKDGIWFSNDDRDISYPEEGNMNCYEIEQDSFWFKHRNNCIIEAVKNFSSNEIFFDIGGGNGYVAKGLQDNNIQSVLIEPGKVGAMNAQKRGLQNIICSTFEDAGIESGICKAIGLFDVVEHIENDSLFLKSINKILADEGLVYITVPAFNILWSKEDVDAGHFRRYSLRQMTNILKSEGFEIVYASYIFSILPIPVFLFRTIPSLLRLNKKSNDLNKQKKEHTAKKGILSNFLNKIWQKELNSIKNKKRIPIGGSCFVVAKKVTDLTHSKSIG